MLNRPTDSASNKELTLLVNDDGTSLEGLAAEVSRLNQIVNLTVSSPSFVPTPQAVNFIRNGTFSHSVKTWYNDGASNDERYECAWMYSHPVVTGQPMYPNTTKTGDATSDFTSVDTGTDTITVTVDLPTGLAFTLTTSGGLPSPLAISTVYYVINVDATHIKVASSYANAIAGTAIDLTTTGTGTQTIHFNYTLKKDSDTQYSAAFSDWDWTLGACRLCGPYDLSAPLPAAIGDPSYTYYATFSIVRTSQYVSFPTNSRIAAGLYGNSTARGWEWLSGDFIPAATVVGSVGTPTSRDYVVHTTTDRGFTIQSTPLTVANAPSDADFAAGARVVISWKQVLNFGVLSYDIYRKTGATYKLLKSVTSGQLTYIDNNSSTAASGYPSYDFQRLVAYTSSQPDTMSLVPYSGDPLSPNWPVVTYAIKVPQNYDKSDTILADGQWLRFYFTGLTNNRADLQVTDGVSNATTTITSAAAQFTSDQVGLTITVSDGTHTDSRTVAAYVSATQLTLNTATTFSASGCTVTITGGAPAHSVYIDLLHLDSQAGAGYSWNAEDISSDRGIPAVAQNGTTQGGGGSGGGSGGDGGLTCLDEDEIVKTSEGDITAGELHDRFWAKEALHLPDGYGGFNKVVDCTRAVNEVFLLQMANGAGLRATATKQVYTPKGKKVLGNLTCDDTVVTDIGNGLEPSKIVAKTSLGKKIVIQLSLLPNHSFLAGNYVLVDNAKPAPGDSIVN